MDQPIVSHDPLPPQALADRVPFHLSPDGRWLAITVQELRPDRPTGERLRHPDGVPPDLTGSRVVLVETTTGKTREPFPPGSASWAPQWSPDGRRLAAYVRHEGPACLAVWDAASGALRFLRQALVRTVYGFEGPQWLPDSRRVAVKLRPIDPEEQQSDTSGSAGSAAEVAVLSFDPAMAEALAGIPDGAPTGDRSRGDLGLIDIATGEVRRLCRGWSFDSFRVAPDGHAIALLRTIVDPEDARGTCYDLVTVAVDEGAVGLGTGVRRLAPRVVQGYGYLVNWSPDSRRIACTDGEAGLLVVADDGEAPQPLATAESLALPSLEEYYQAPRWSVDGRWIYVLSRAIWAIAADGSARRPIDPDLGGRRLLSWVQPAPTTPVLRTLDGRVILVTTRDPATKKEGLARIDLETGEGELLAEWEHVYGMDAHFQTEMAGDGSAAYLASQAADQPPCVWRVTGDFRTRHSLVSLWPEIEKGPPTERRRLIEYRTVGSRGEKRQAVLWLPPSYEEGRCLPVIVDLYPGVRVSTFVHGAEPRRFLGLLNSRGYAILKPDALAHGSDMLRQLAGEVVPAINYLIDQGIADPQRIGLFGHSRGGHAALGLITQTDRFGAAVVSAAQVTLTSYGTHPADFVQCESGIYACGGTLWEKREAFIENSPLFYLDRVRTPLLVIVGTASADEELQARQTFGALRRLGQRVELRLYRDEDHDPAAWTEPSYRDVAERIVAWFDQNLKG